MFRQIKFATWPILCLIGVVIGSLWHLSKPAASSPISVPTIEMVKELSELPTVRVVIADVVTSHIYGISGCVEAVLVIRGDAYTRGAAR